MSKQKLYAVRKGRVPGIYSSWEKCSQQVTGFPGAVYKSFESRAAAEQFLRGTAPVRLRAARPSIPANPDESQQAASSEQTSADILTTVAIYTDGGCLVNPGPGGYGVVLKIGRRRSERSGGFRRTTNNRMELTACIAGLHALTAGSGPSPSADFAEGIARSTADALCPASARSRESASTGCGTAGSRVPAGSIVTLYTDSKYLANGITKGWAKRWRAMAWVRAGEPVPNADLWQQLLALCERHKVTFEWLQGHAGNPENERCHVLAAQALRRKNLPVDRGYAAAHK
jgi:ribonuclease HI